MAKVIALCQVKGGAGRSTVSTNLAAELSKRGKTVLIDADLPQATAASWFAIRKQAKPNTSLTTATAKDHHDLLQKVRQYADADFVVIDGPPRIAEVTRVLLLLSDVTLIPVGASVAEIWATTDVLSIIEEARKVKPIDARVVWTRYRSHTKLAKELGSQAKSELRLPILESVLALRVAYPDALGNGLSVAEVADQTARAEITAFVNEVVGIVNK